VAVRRRIPSRTHTNPLNVDYLKTKRDRSGHLIEFLDEEGSEAKAG
jgi:GTP cyclohydrolase II/3,4-dihydroxy 2-butanone 4-phosphate synthase/GTP cyclohydrolase II